MKNTLRFIVMALPLLLSFNTYSMLLGLKTILNRTGTVFGVGISTIPYLFLSGRDLYLHTQDPVLTLEKFSRRELREPTETETYFLRENANLQKDTRLYIAKKAKYPDSAYLFWGASFNGTIAISEHLPGFKKTLSQAIEDRDYTHASRYVSVVEHEEGHNKKRHSLKILVLAGIVPIISIVTITKICKALAPYNSRASLWVHGTRFLAKTFGGYALLIVNGKSCSMYKKHAEFQADRHVQPKHRPALFQVLNASDRVKEKKKQNGLIKKQAAWQKWLATHPTTEQRSIALMGN